MKYFNQNNYPNALYPSPTAPKATIKSGGCGATSMAMIVSNSTNKVVDPPTMAKFAIQKGARVSGGTDMRVLSTAINKEYGLKVKTTNDEKELLNHLKSGGMAIANVGGNRSGWIGVFSDVGHYVVVAKAEGNTVFVLDPGYYTGKFNKVGRKGKVTVSGNFCKCDISVLGKDTENRSPSYYLFSKKEVAKVSDTPSSWAKEAWVWAKEKGLMDGKNPQGNVTREQLATILYRLKTGGK